MNNTTAAGTADNLFDLEAEQAVLGAAMLSQDVLVDMAAIVRPESFYRPQNGTIFRTIQELDRQGQPVDPLTVAAALAGSDNLVRVGGAPYLHTLIASVPVAANGPHYARTVADLAGLRGLRAVAAHLSVVGRHTNFETTVESVRQMLVDLETGTAGDRETTQWRDVIPVVLDAIAVAKKQTDSGGIAGLPTGLPDLDDMLNGLRPGQLVIVAGRPGMGKSVVSTGFAQHASWRLNKPTALFNFEMDRVEMGERLFSAGSKVPLNVIRSGQLSELDWDALTKTITESNDAPLFIEDYATLTLADIRARCRDIKRRHGLDLVVVDYLQLMPSAKNAPNREREVAELSRGLKLLARELACPVIAVCQLNRGPENRADKRPSKADLRESGSLENDADVIILTHRDDYYDAESPRAGEMDLIVDKSRSGPTGTITVAAQMHMARVMSMAL